MNLPPLAMQQMMMANNFDPNFMRGMNRNRMGGGGMGPFVGVEGMTSPNGSSSRSLPTGPKSTNFPQGIPDPIAAPDGGPNHPSSTSPLNDNATIPVGPASVEPDPRMMMMMAGMNPQQQMQAMQQMVTMQQQQGFYPGGGVPGFFGPQHGGYASGPGGRGGAGFRGRGGRGGEGRSNNGNENENGPLSTHINRTRSPGPDASSKPPPDRSSTTLVVSSIPSNCLSLAPINEHFSQFGTVTNIAIEVASARALVSFETNEQAYKAWKSESVLFGSRFVKVLWHRPIMGHGAKGKEALLKSKDAINRLKASANRAEVLTRQRELEGQIAKQKVLMMRVSKEGISKEEKKELMDELRKVTEEMKSGGGVESLVVLDKKAAAKGSVIVNGGAGTGASADEEEEKRNALDRELEGRNNRTEADPVGDTMQGVVVEGEEGDESANTEMLKQKLASLKAEVSPKFRFRAGD